MLCLPYLSWSNHICFAQVKSLEANWDTFFYIFCLIHQEFLFTLPLECSQNSAPSHHICYYYLVRSPLSFLALIYHRNLTDLLALIHVPLPLSVLSRAAGNTSISCILQDQVTPLGFYEGPTLVRVFTNWKKSEDFCFYKKDWKVTIASRACFAVSF